MKEDLRPAEAALAKPLQLVKLVKEAKGRREEDELGYRRLSQAFRPRDDLPVEPPVQSSCASGRLTPTLFLNTLLMERALESLVRSETPAPEIGFDLGFSSESGFAKFFAANAGMAPSDYRRAAHVL
jgi:hypothetical protein